MRHASILKALSAEQKKQEQSLHRAEEDLQRRATQLDSAKDMASQRRKAQISNGSINGALLKHTLIFTSQEISGGEDEYSRCRQQHEAKKTLWRRRREQVEHIKSQKEQQEKDKASKIDRKETDAVVVSAACAA